MNETWSAEALRNLEILFPGNLKKDALGRPFPTITKEEANYLLDAYPSMFPEDGQASGPRSEEEKALAARFPTMYRPK